jgi:divalent metal cation (Fe/Co/Zn/Cd) transporter
LVQMPEVSEVLVHVDVDEGAALTPSSQPTPLPAEVAQAVRAALRPLPDVRDVAHVLVHFLNGATLVEVQITVDPALRVAEARAVAARAKQTLEAVPGVDEAHVDVEVNDGHHWSRLHSRPVPRDEP